MCSSDLDNNKVYKFLLILFHFILKPPVYKAFAFIIVSNCFLHTFYTLYTASIFLISSNKVSSGFRNHIGQHLDQIGHVAGNGNAKQAGQELIQPVQHAK